MSETFHHFIPFKQALRRVSRSLRASPASEASTL
jgi:hypothetical protein